MTKVIFIIVAALGVLLITGLILSIVAPKKISVRSTQFIQASRQQVFDQLRFMKNFPAWSPFRQQDPEQQFEISGPDGEVGATFSWVGVKEKSRGSQQVVGISGTESLKIQCSITEPFQSNPTFSYTLSDKDGGVELVQDFEVEMPVPANVFGMLMGLQKNIAATNQQGLNLLKQVTEKQYATPLTAH